MLIRLCIGVSQANHGLKVFIRVVNRHEITKHQKLSVHKLFKNYKALP